MDILHIGLLSHFTEGMLYQDNVLCEMNAQAGHKVTFITDTLCYIDGSLQEVAEEDRVMENGARLIRLRYDSLGIPFLTNKIQHVSKLKSYLDEIQPDTILYHGLCGYELLDVAKYIEGHPSVLFYADSHEDFHNTARTPISKFAYKYIHGYFVRKALPQIRKVLYLSLETKEYLQEMYSIPEESLEFYPLGSVIVSPDVQNKCRQKLVAQYYLPQDAIICAHSGKMIPGKKTKELLSTFSKVTDKKLCMLIFGQIPEEQKNDLQPLIEADGRIHYLGWKNDGEMMDILSGTDLYCQPGTQSATFQVALGCGCAVMLYPYSSHKFLVGEQCFYVENENEISDVLKNVSASNSSLTQKKKEAYKIACEKLDYSMLAERICR